MTTNDGIYEIRQAWRVCDNRPAVHISFNPAGSVGSTTGDISSSQGQHHPNYPCIDEQNHIMTQR